VTATLIDGRSVAKHIRSQVKEKIRVLRSAGGRAPCLAVILVGDHPASKIYVANKQKACAEVGIESRLFEMPADVAQGEVLDLIGRLNHDPTVDGILPQLPLPKHLDKVGTIHAVDHSKDVDGLSPVSQGLLEWGLPGLYPCTPSGILELLRHAGVHIEGMLAAILGRSLLVGAPTSTLLSHAGATTINMQSGTRNTKDLCRQADIVIVATGIIGLVQADWIKPGATVVDVGIHRRADGTVCGDVDFEQVAHVAGRITPVPGGVGPMTIAMLLRNCLYAYEHRSSNS
jgi:methylenetetrahydrofolate dehydrogenase (NADP+) / methenyltetrahydrofolate cyclohydrolase